MDFGVGLAIDDWDQIGRAEAVRDVGHAKAGDGLAALGMMRRETPDHGAAPIMANPDGAVAAEMDEQIEHVLDAVLDRVIAIGAVGGGPAVAAHVRGDAAEAEGGEAAQLMAPAMPEFRPTVDEDDERAGFGAAGGQIENWSGGRFS